MRSRLVIPAAILVAAAYVRGRHHAFLFAPAAPRLPAPGPSRESILRAQAEAADAWEMGLAEAEVAATAYAPEPIILARPVMAPEPAPAPQAAPFAPFAPRPSAPELDPALLSEWLAQPAGAAARIEESGRFSLGGWAAQPGHMALCGVTFRMRQEAPVGVGRVRLVTEASRNVAAGGLIVPSDPGFAPDIEGFTILLAASGPGAFAVSGRYELLSDVAR